MVARAGALAAKTAGLCQLRALLVTCPEPLRSELRSLTRARLLRRLAEPLVPCASRAPADPPEYGRLRTSVDFSGLDRAVTETFRFHLSKRLDARTGMDGAEGEGFEPSKSLHP
jgi:hypothetical protein